MIAYLIDPFERQVRQMFLPNEFQLVQETLQNILETARFCAHPGLAEADQFLLNPVRLFSNEGGFIFKGKIPFFGKVVVIGLNFTIDNPENPPTISIDQLRASIQFLDEMEIRRIPDERKASIYNALTTGNARDPLRTVFTDLF